MIQKHLSRKGGTGQLVKYVARYLIKEEKEKKATKKGEISKLILRHNVRARSVPGYVKEFELNEANRIVKRKDNTKVVHTILSFSNLDKEHITYQVLKDIAKHYVSLRGANNLYVFYAHFDRDHIHLHGVMSGTQLNGRSSRISRAELHQLKVEMDRFQLERFPQLQHSLPKHGRKQHEKNKEELKNIKRNERATDKNALLEVLRTSFEKSSSQEQFFELLKSEGFSPYYRSGKLTGLQQPDGMKFRLGRIGYAPEKLQELDLRKEKEIQTLREMLELRQRQNKAVVRDITRNDKSQYTKDESTERTYEETALAEIENIRDSAERGTGKGREIEEEDEWDEETEDYQIESEAGIDED